MATYWNILEMTLIVNNRLFGIFLWAVLACNLENASPQNSPDSEIPLLLPKTPLVEHSPIPAVVNQSHYPFYNSDESTFTLQDFFAIPEGYQSKQYPHDSFSFWLQHLPILDRQVVYSHTGSKINAPAWAIVAMDTGKGDVQQCADSILRLYSEYLWSQNRVENWGIHFTSGDLSKWRDWKNGERFIIGKQVKRTQTGPKDASYEQFQKWMHHSFLYAGTRSIAKEAFPVSIEADIEVGDFFLSAGSPGHVILVMHILTHPEQPPIAILGQGFMPAQEFHLLQVNNNPWFVLPQDEETPLNTPSWQPFYRSNLHRFQEIQY